MLRKIAAEHPNADFFNTIGGKRTFKRNLFEFQATGFATDAMGS